MGRKRQGIKSRIFNIFVFFYLFPPFPSLTPPFPSLSLLLLSYLAYYILCYSSFQPHDLSLSSLPLSLSLSTPQAPRRQALWWARWRARLPAAGLGEKQSSTGRQEARKYRGQCGQAQLGLSLGDRSHRDRRWIVALVGSSRGLFEIGVTVAFRFNNSCCFSLSCRSFVLPATPPCSYYPLFFFFFLRHYFSSSLFTFIFRL